MYWLAPFHSFAQDFIFQDQMRCLLVPLNNPLRILQANGRFIYALLVL
jgi:hypothetical protein